MRPKEHQNQSYYHPKKDTEASAIWSSFVKNINDNDVSYNAPARMRLSVFLAIDAKSKTTSNPAAVILPHIRHIDTKHDHLVHAEATWRELLLGEGEDKDGSWKRAIERKKTQDSQDNNSRRNTAARLSPELRSVSIELKMANNM